MPKPYKILNNTSPGSSGSVGGDDWDEVITDLNNYYDQYTYTIFIDSNTIKARNNVTGTIDYSGDATTDCAPTITSAINNLTNVGSNQDADFTGGIFITAGYYKCITTISCDCNSVGAHGVSIVGEGKGTFLDFAPAGALTNGLYVKMSHPVLSNFYIRGNANVTNVIKIDNNGTPGTNPRADGGIIDNLIVNGPTDKGQFHLTGTSYTVVSGQRGIFMTAPAGQGSLFFWSIRNCSFLTLETGILWDGLNCTSCRVTDCYFHACKEGIISQTDSGSHQIQGCWFAGHDQGISGIRVKSGSGFISIINTFGEVNKAATTSALLTIDSGASAGSVYFWNSENITADNVTWFHVIDNSGTANYTAPWNYNSKAGSMLFTYDSATTSMDILAPIFSVTKQLALTGVRSPTQITSDQNNYNPTNLSISNRLRLDADSSFRTITGLAGGSNGRVIVLSNISDNTILLANQNASSTASNRFDFAGYDIPLFGKSQIVLIYDSSSSVWRSTYTNTFIIPPARQGFYSMGHFIQGNSEGLMTGTAATGGTAGIITTVAGHAGVTEFTQGTSTTGTGSLRTGQSLALLGNSWYWRFGAVLKVVKLSDGTDDYTLRVGFIDSGTAESTDAVMFRYNDGVNSGKWERVTRSNTTETASDTGSTVDTNWHRFTVIVNPAGTNAEFFIDGVSVGSNTTNIPTGAGRVVGWGIQFVKTLGTTDNIMLDVDSVEVVAYSNTTL